MAGHKPGRAPAPLRPEWLFLVIIGAFVAVVAALYGWWTWYVDDQIEWIGTTALVLLVLLCAMSGGYLLKLSREIDLRPEDDPHAEVDEGAGEYGHFSPWSWWPLICGVAIALIFLGPAVHQWWVTGIGAVVGVVGVAGHVLEYNRGPHAH